MCGRAVSSAGSGGMIGREPHGRLAAVADGGRVVSLDVPRASPYLARFGIAPQQDDGIAIARIAVDGAPVLAAAQDERFLRGSVGTRHGDALRALFERSRDERPVAVLLLLASGGVRLHEANAAELSLARALRALFDTRAADVPVLAICVGDVFGGASVLACATDRLAMLPATRIGLSGPKVIESVHGKWALDAERAEDVDSVFGALARSRAGDVDLVADDRDALRAWIRVAAQGRVAFARHVTDTHALLGGKAPPPPPAPPLPFLARQAAARPLDEAGWLWQAAGMLWALPAPGLSFSDGLARALDTALLERFRGAGADAPAMLVIVEDSAGHEVSRAAEMRFASRSLAHHAAILALARARGHRVVGLLAGTGHSAAFFANALQAPELLALSGARVIAMEPSAIARVTGLPAAALIENDPLLGQPVRHLAALGGVDRIVDEADIVPALARMRGDAS
jgi:malonate decarboxylase beta subunit